MRDDLLLYYERELTYLRRLGAEFAARYPKVASRLQLEPTKCEDPHVERLLEGFAFLTARVHHRLDGDLPEVSEALLDVLHPQHVRPIPSLSLVELELDPELGKLPGGHHVPRGSELRSASVQGLALRFRSCYDVTLWPITVAAAEWTSADRVVGGGVRVGEAVGAIRLELRAFDDFKLAELTTDSALRFYLAGDATVADTLHELLLNNCLRVIVRDPDQPSRAPVVLSAGAVRPVGYEEHEAMLPYPRRAFAGFTLLQELFAFPQKFLFVEVGGVAAALRALGAGSRAELSFIFAPFERAERRQAVELGVNARTFRLGCTPIVNLFEQIAEPILLTQRQPEYIVVPDARRRLEIETWSIDSVTGITPGQGDPMPIEALYALRPGATGGAPTRAACSGTPCGARPSGAATRGPRSRSRSRICRDGCARRTPRSRRCA